MRMKELVMQMPAQERRVRRPGFEVLVLVCLHALETTIHERLVAQKQDLGGAHHFPELRKSAVASEMYRTFVGEVLAAVSILDAIF